mgnify:FL=1
MNKVQVYWETIKGAIKNPLFIVVVIGIVTALSNNDVGGMIVAVIGFVGIKTVVNLGTPTSEADKDLSVFEH